MFGEYLPPKNSVLQLNHRVEFFNVYSKITLSFNHDIPKWSQYKSWFSDTSLFIEAKISISSHESNYLVNSRPETLLILVKHAINEQSISKLPYHVALRHATLTLKITTSLPAVIAQIFIVFRDMYLQRKTFLRGA